MTLSGRPSYFELKEGTKKVHNQDDLMPDYVSDDDYVDNDDNEAGLKVDSMGNYIYPDEEHYDDDENGNIES